MRANVQSPTDVEQIWEGIDLYRFFAHALGAPSAERLEWFRQPNLASRLAELWPRLQCKGDFPGFDSFADFGEYESTYIALFDVGVPEPPVPLFESAYYRSVPAQQTALENTSFYEVLGLRADPAHSAPDHLLTQLEFLSVVRYLRENAPDELSRENLTRLEKDFLERHLLNWVPAAAQKLSRHPVATFPVLFALLAAYLKKQAEELVSPALT